MTNKEIAKSFQTLAKIMELYGENPFKIRSYQSAYNSLRKLERPLAEMSPNEISDLKGVGKAITGKIGELLQEGQMATLEKYRAKTPVGIQEMLQIKGFGPKKIKVIWDDLGIESIGELLYAVNENRLIELKGFGQKTQEELKKQLEYFQKSKHQYHYASLEKVGLPLLENIKATLSGARVEFTGAMRRKTNTLERIEIIIGYNGPIDLIFERVLELRQKINDQLYAATIDEMPVYVYHFKFEEFGSKQFRYTASKKFMDEFLTAFSTFDFKNLEQEKDIFEKVGIHPVPPELREGAKIIEISKNYDFQDLVTVKDINGVIHAHTTYSDGLHSLNEMASTAQNLGYQYIGITDHSQSAFYANGLKPDRLLEQLAAIDEWNKNAKGFQILKGIESDILSDGKLDYEDNLLAQLDFVIASIHSNLKMDKDKATTRLLKAIENPYTNILGHPTGRLLLSRPGYPIDHHKVIDACAANLVAIELNANPYRLDLDWSYIAYAMEKGVKISINPDAHSTEGIKDIHYGVLSARKGGLTKAMCLNTLDVDGFLSFCQEKRG